MCSGEGSTVRLLALSLAIFCLCLAPLGCSMFDKNKTSGNGNGSGNGGTRDADKTKGDPLFGSPSRAEAPKQAAADAPVAPLLAGSVRDYTDRPMTSASILLARAEDKDPSAGQEVAVDGAGQFVIENLKPGVQYRLTARAKNGDQLMAGTTFSTAPNSRLLILVDQKFVTADTPPMPGPPSPSKPPKAAYNPDLDGNVPAVGGIPLPSSGAGQDGGSSPVSNATPFPPRVQPGQDEPAEVIQVMIPIPKIAIPVSPTAPTWDPGPPPWKPPTPASEPDRPPSPVVDSTPPKRPWPPNMDTTGLKKRPSEELKLPLPPPSPPAQIRPGPDELPPPPDLKFENRGNELTQGDTVRPIAVPSRPEPGPVRVPSCVVKDNRLVNFALNELNGDPWDYQRDHRGKLILIDFWFTSCPYCHPIVPSLCDLQRRYGNKGLEIVGIACESHGTAPAQAQRVNKYCLDHHVNYRQLLWAGRDVCPVTQQFHVNSYPTLVLLDESGKVLWRHSGMLQRHEQDQLERILQAKLQP